MFRSLAKTSRVVVALILREMTTTYGKSPGGYLWVVIEPAAGIVLLSFMFSLMMRNPPLGINFAIFYATGVLPFTCYMDLVGKIGQSIKFSKQLLAYPAVTFMDALIARLLLNGMTQMLVFYLIMGAILMMYDTRAVLDYPTIVLALALALALGFGVGTLNCLLFAFFPLYQRLWGIVTRPLLLVSCIFFTYESLSDSIQKVLWYNPIIHIVGLMRRGVYAQYPADYVSVNYVLLCAGVPAVLGLFFLHRYYRVILYEL